MVRQVTRNSSSESAACFKAPLQVGDSLRLTEVSCLKFVRRRATSAASPITDAQHDPGTKAEPSIKIRPI